MESLAAQLPDVYPVGGQCKKIVSSGVNASDGRRQAAVPRRLIGAEQIEETTEDEYWLKNEKFSAEKTERKLQELYSQREQLQRDFQKIKDNLQDIDEQIKSLEEEIKIKIKPERLILIERLSETEKLARVYSNLVLKNFPNLQKEIDSQSGRIDEFLIEIERWLEKISDALSYDNLSFLDCPDPNLYLLNSSSYKYAEVKVYEELFSLIEKDLSRSLPEEVKNDLSECVNSLKAEVLRYV